MSQKRTEISNKFAMAEFRLEKMSFSRNHMPASSCEHLQPLIHLGRRYYLSTTSGTISTSKGHMDISTLAVYNFPCNVSIDNYEMALSTCPERLLVSLPMFTTNSVSYVKWKPDLSDQTTLQLHHQSLTIPPETKINHSIVKELDDIYQCYDSQLSATLQKVDSLVDQINKTAEGSLSVYLTYAALALSVLNSVAMIIGFSSAGYHKRHYQLLHCNQLCLSNIQAATSNLK